MNTVYCVNCGHPNAGTNTTCSHCGKPLARLGQQQGASYSPGTGFTYRLELWWRGLEPPLKASLTIIIALFALVSIESVIPVIGCLGVLPLWIVIYAAQGILVVNYARDKGGYVEADYTRLAFKSSLWSIAFSTALRLFADLAKYGLSVGVLIVALPFDLAAAIVGGLLPMVVTVTFAYLHAHNRLPKLSAASAVTFSTFAIIVSCCLLLIAGGVAATVLLNSQR